MGKKGQRKKVIFVCGPSKEYFYGDPRPPKEMGYMEFVEWQEAQLRGRRKKSRLRGEMLGWHFLCADRRLRTGEVVEAGGRYTAHGPLILCQNGMHACRRALDALNYAKGPIVCRVRLSVDLRHDSDKTVARSRHVLWMADATLLLYEFALSVAMDALCAQEVKGQPVDPRSWTAVDTKQRWLDGKATDEELQAAWDAAMAAAGAAAGDAAWAVRSSSKAAGAAAWAAAWDAAGAVRSASKAAGAAAWAAARDSAWAVRAAAGSAWAASEAAGAAAGDAARDSAWAAYNVQLETMLMSLTTWPLGSVPP